MHVIHDVVHYSDQLGLCWASVLGLYSFAEEGCPGGIDEGLVIEILKEMGMSRIVTARMGGLQVAELYCSGLMHMSRSLYPFQLRDLKVSMLLTSSLPYSHVVEEGTTGLMSLTNISLSSANE